MNKDIIGLTHLDEIQGDKERNREAYSVYAKWLSDAGNKEVRQMGKSYTNERGYIALVSTITISILLLAVILGASITGFYNRLDILNHEYKQRSVSLAEACADVALLNLTGNPLYTGSTTVAIGPDACTIYPVMASAGQYLIKTKAIYQRAVTNIGVVASSSDMSIVSWQELLTFP